MKCASSFCCSTVLTLLLALTVAQSGPLASAATLPPVKFASAITTGFQLGLSTVVDVNNDGNPDLVGMSTCSGVPCLMVSLGKGDGTFNPPTSYNALGWGSVTVAVADINGDTKLDLIAVSECVSMSNCLGGGELSVLLGNGDGTFQPAAGYNTGALFPTSVAVADVNHDNKLDVLVGHSYQNSSETNGAVSVLLGKGNGTFKPAVVYNTGAEQALSVQVADLNDDGHPDLVVANGCASCAGGVSVLLGNANGTFQSPISYPTAGYSSQAVVIADVNGDNKPDIIVADLYPTADNMNNYAGQGLVSVLLGDGNGTFQPPVGYDSGGWRSRDLAVKDLNGDGKPDVVVANACTVGSKTCSTGNVGVLVGNGDGTLQKAVTYKATTSTNQGQAEFVAIEDVNADKKPDLIVTNSEGFVFVLLNDLIAATTATVTASPNPAAIGQSVTFTATITSNPPIPDGETVSFYKGTTVIGTGVTTDGVATMSTSFPKAGKDTIKASYPGDIFHKLSSHTVIETINP